MDTFLKIQSSTGKRKHPKKAAEQRVF